MTDFAAPAFAQTPNAPTRPRAYFGIAITYLVAYIGLNLLTDHRSLNGTSITLWSPDDALSVMLIMESWTFAPVLWLAQIVSDRLFNHVGHSVLANIGVETTLAAGYFGIAWTLRRQFGLVARTMRPRDLIAMTAVVPVGVAIVGLFYCGALYAVGDLDRGAFMFSYAGFWIGDSCAMCVIIPAVGAFFRVFFAKPWRQPQIGYPLFLFAATFVFVGLVVLVSAANVQSRYLFNLLYLPMLLIGMKFGYDAGALALLGVQAFLLVALDLFHVNDREFGAYQILMFLLAISGQAIGAAFTEWQAATAQLRRQQAELAKMSERATNSAIAAAMSHEISQPLASIATYVFAARRLLETGQGQDKALAALRKADGEAARARRIVERLRDLVANGAMELESVDLDDLCHTILKLQNDAAQERGAALVRAPREAGPLRANADRVALEQAVANLVLNAIEAAPAGNGRVVLSLTRRDGKALIGVEDNGDGVSPDIAEHLFEPFETTKPRGMGLGLPLAKEIAVRHGGALTWRALTPRGTRFELTLPLA